MPKIMFRPAPTPPPFVPPTPTYDTTVYAKTNPFPVQGGSYFTAVFMSANVPAFNNVKIWICTEPLVQSDELAVFAMTNEDFGTEMNEMALYDSDIAPFLSIEFWADSTKVHEANLILSELE